MRRSSLASRQARPATHLVRRLPGILLFTIVLDAFLLRDTITLGTLVRASTRVLDECGIILEYDALSLTYATLAQCL